MVYPDDKSHILKALKEAEQNADIIIITGGLGPTKDDITKKTIAWKRHALKQKLQRIMPPPAKTPFFFVTLWYKTNNYVLLSCSYSPGIPSTA